ncbi:TMCO1/EMC3 family protein [Candidatus Pacearchaeota archaeon]|nr:TMCO1/EMC3 family protein [Candidatus Pacearchaeota archaeon]
MNKGMRIMLIVLGISLLVGLFWNSVPLIKQTAHAVLDPTAGRLLTNNVTVGLITIAVLVMFIITLLQKYTTDQNELRKIKQEQKLLQEEMKKYKDHPEKLMQLQKKSLEFLPKTMDITMKPSMYTAIPMILLFRWFNDYFTGTSVKVFGFMSWFWGFFILMIVMSIVWRKVLKAA